MRPRIRSRIRPRILLRLRIDRKRKISKMRFIFKIDSTIITLFLFFQKHAFSFKIEKTNRPGPEKKVCVVKIGFLGIPWHQKEENNVIACRRADVTIIRFWEAS